MSLNFRSSSPRETVTASIISSVKSLCICNFAIPCQCTVTEGPKSVDCAALEVDRQIQGLRTDAHSDTRALPTMPTILNVSTTSRNRSITDHSAPVVSTAVCIDNNTEVLDLLAEV